MSGIVKPWEETWSYDEDAEPAPVLEVDLRPFASMHVVDNLETQTARARLASAAPDMARLLLDLEWSGSCEIDYEISVASCPSCGGLQEPSKYNDWEKPVGHASDCRWVAVVVKAGVLP